MSKKGTPLKTCKRDRRGGGYDVCVRLYINNKYKKFTLSRLVLSCFKGPGYGYEANHIDRNPLNNHVGNLEWVTASENQKHWRSAELL